MNAADAAVIAGLDPALQLGALALVKWAGQAGVPLHFTSGYRSAADQARVCAQIAAGVLPPAPCAAPGQSFHQYMGAFDVSGPRTPAEWNAAGLAGEAAGLVWGGRWSPPDLVHFQLPGTLAALRSRHDLERVAVAAMLAMAFTA